MALGRFCRCIRPAAFGNKRRREESQCYAIVDDSLLGQRDDDVATTHASPAEVADDTDVGDDPNGKNEVADESEPPRDRVTGSQVCSAEAQQLKLVFEPGAIGLRLDEKSGCVARVHASEQAERLGVRAGMRLLSVNGGPFTKEALIAVGCSNENYKLVFSIEFPAIPCSSGDPRCTVHTDVSTHQDVVLVLPHVDAEPEEMDVAPAVLLELTQSFGNGDATIAVEDATIAVEDATIAVEAVDITVPPTPTKEWLPRENSIISSSTPRISLLERDMSRFSGVSSHSKLHFERHTPNAGDTPCTPMGSSLPAMEDRKLEERSSPQTVLDAEAPTVQFSMKLDNVSYADLTANVALADNLKACLRESVAASAGDGVQPEHVQIALSAGSVVATFQITPPAGVLADNVASNLGSGSVSTDVLAKVQALPGIAEVCTGEIAVAVVDAPYVAEAQDCNEEAFDPEAVRETVEQMLETTDNIKGLTQTGEVALIIFDATEYDRVQGDYELLDIQANECPVFQSVNDPSICAYFVEVSDGQMGWVIRESYPDFSSFDLYRNVSDSVRPWSCTGAWEASRWTADGSSAGGTVTWRKERSMFLYSSTWDDPEESDNDDEQQDDGEEPEWEGEDEDCWEDPDPEDDDNWPEEEEQDDGVLRQERLPQLGDGERPESEVFVDPDFPASEESIGNCKAGKKVVEWRRLVDIVGEESSLFTTMQPTDIGQVNWFDAAIAVVASYPAWIRQLFGKHQRLDPSGRYEVKLYHPGKKAFETITIDDVVPCTKTRPVFARATENNELYVALIEKAFAKFSGSYAAADSGEVAWGLHYLTGGQGEEWLREDGETEWSRYVMKWTGEEGSGQFSRGIAQNDDDESKDSAFETLDHDNCPTKRSTGQMWAAIHNYTTKNFPVCCSVGETHPDMKGLLQGHAYCLLAVQTVTLPAADGDAAQSQIVRLVKLRNPCGKTEWTGAWSDGSTIWKKYPAIKKECQQKDLDDGIFWMALTDFVRYFDSIVVVKKRMPLQGCHPDKLRIARAARATTAACPDAGSARAASPRGSAASPRGSAASPRGSARGSPRGSARESPRGSARGSPRGSEGSGGGGY